MAEWRAAAALVHPQGAAVRVARHREARAVHAVTPPVERAGRLSASPAILTVKTWHPQVAVQAAAVQQLGIQEVQALVALACQHLEAAACEPHEASSALAVALLVRLAT